MRSFKNALVALVAIVGTAPVAFAEEAGAVVGSASGLVGLSAAIAIGLAAFGCGLGQGKAVSAGLESIGRNPAAAGKILTPLVLGLVFIETLTIFSFVVAYLLMGKM